MSADDDRSPASKADVRRGQILAAAETCVLDEGFHRASISKICKVAGMSPGHVYHYFENKEAIIAALVRQDLDRILDMTAGMRASPDVLEAMVGRVAKGVGEKLDPREARLKLEIAAEASRNPNIAPIVHDADRCSLASLRETIAAARRGHGLSDDDATALHFLIESLNEDGYLEDSLEELAASLSPADEEELEQLQHHFRIALITLKGFDPVGVGASDLGECLRLQVQALQRALPADDAQQEPLAVAMRICSQPMDLLARRDVRKLSQLCGASDAAIRDAMVLIARLEPKPGRRFVNVERNIIVPDVLVVQVGSGANVRFRARINPQVMPRLRVHDIYANALRQHRGSGSDASNYAALQQRLQEARWFIKNIQQRFDTILRVSTAIVERQKNFFLHGVLAMRPLVLREIADELGLHESTISRVTTAKYMATPLGTFELKYFFGSALGTESGGNASSTAVRALIKQFIDAESPKKPLSDNQLSEMLKEQGIACARRTVAKYREGLRIAPANLRRAL